MIEIKVDFEELMYAFEQSNVSNHFFIDLKKNEIVNINEYLELNASEKLEEMDNKRYIKIPERFPWDEKMLMESFAYSLETLNLVDEFLNALNRGKPFRNFKALLSRYPELRDRWHAHRDKEIKNQLIDWLVANDTRIIGQEEKIVKNIEITELTSGEINELDEEIRTFSPIGCMSCDFKGNLKGRIFSVNIEPENKLDEIQIAEIMKKKFNVTHFGISVGGKCKGCYITASKCPKCNSEDIFWDY